MTRAQSCDFKKDVVEPDSCRTGSKRKGSTDGTRAHLGRTLVVKGRYSKARIARPLASRETKKGRGGGGPETCAEVTPPWTRVLGEGTVVAPDGSQALHSAASEAGRPSLKGVKHITKVFTPVAKLLKSKLANDVVKMLRSSTKGKRPQVKEPKLYFVLAAGDNAAESMSGHIKNTMRRLGDMGRPNIAVPIAKNVQALAAAALLRRAGFQSVLDALRQYRIACSIGAVSLPPKNAFSMESVSGWLLREERCAARASGLQHQ